MKLETLKTEIQNAETEAELIEISEKVFNAFQSNLLSRWDHASLIGAIEDKAIDNGWNSLLPDYDLSL